MTERIQISDDFFIDIIEHEKATVRVYSKKELHCHDALGRCSALDKAALAEAHIKENSLQCYHGQLYGPDGPVCDELVEAELTQTLREMDYRNGIPFAVREILKLIRGLCYQPGNLSPSPTILPFADGDLDISSEPWRFNRGSKIVTPHRFKINFPRERTDCPGWKCFLSELLSPEDIKTLQVFLGYALTPSIDAQAL